MDSSTIRLVAGIIALVLIGVLILRRRTKAR